MFIKNHHLSFNSFFHEFIQQTFIDYVSHARHCASYHFYNENNIETILPIFFVLNYLFLFNFSLILQV